MGGSIDVVGLVTENAIVVPGFLGSNAFIVLVVFFCAQLAVVVPEFTDAVQLPITKTGFKLENAVVVVKAADPSLLAVLIESSYVDSSLTVIASVGPMWNAVVVGLLFAERDVVVVVVSKDSVIFPSLIHEVAVQHSTNDFLNRAVGIDLAAVEGMIGRLANAAVRGSGEDFLKT
jgi:hypothetical protein